MLRQHVDIPAVALVLGQHVVPHHILTGPAGNTQSQRYHGNVLPVTLCGAEPDDGHSPQRRQGGAVDRGHKYVVKVEVQEASTHLLAALRRPPPGACPVFVGACPV